MSLNGSPYYPQVLYHVPESEQSYEEDSIVYVDSDTESEDDIENEAFKYQLYLMECVCPEVRAFDALTQLKPCGYDFKCQKEYNQVVDDIKFHRIPKLKRVKQLSWTRLFRRVFLSESDWSPPRY